MDRITEKYEFNNSEFRVPESYHCVSTEHDIIFFW